MRAETTGHSLFEAHLSIYLNIDKAFEKNNKTIFLPLLVGKELNDFKIFSKSFEFVTFEINEDFLKIIIGLKF